MSLYREGKRWVFEVVVDGRRIRQRLRVTDRRAAEEMARDIQLKSDRERAGLVDPFEVHRTRPLEDHVDDYEMFLRAKGVTPKHRDERIGYLRSYMVATGAHRLMDLDAPAGSGWLLGLRREGLSARSCNKRRSALLAFSHFLVGERRLPLDPFVSLARQNEAKDRRHVRRAPSEEEMDRILGTVTDYRRYLYVAASNSGLRKEELHALRRSDFDISDPDRATVRLLGADTKNGDDAALPLPRSAVFILKAYLEGIEADALVFPTVPNPKTFDADLLRAGVAKKTADGLLDFHALRSYYATALARAGVSPAQAQKLLRHADPRLTLGVYTRLGLNDMHEAAAKLDADRDTKRAVRQSRKASSTGGAKSGDLAGPWGEWPEP